jgi:uncharacterized LabA/DUF88 family protein
MQKIIELDRAHSVSLYWDYENVRFPLQSKDLYALGQSYGRVLTASAYAQWQKEHKPHQVIVFENRFRCIDIPVKIKNGVDYQLISDCRFEFVANSSTSVLILIAGDKDYVTVVKELQVRGVRVVIVANPDNASRKLLRLVNEEDVHDINQLCVVAA